jgi:hypothetical protein
MGLVDIDLEKAAAWSHAPEGPVVMLNLYKFKSDADMTRFSAELQKTMGTAAAETGLEVIYSGVAGPEFVAGEDWELVALVRYPSYEAMLSIFKDDATRGALEEVRRSTLAESRFMVTTERKFFAPSRD